MRVSAYHIANATIPDVPTKGRELHPGMPYSTTPNAATRSLGQLGRSAAAIASFLASPSATVLIFAEFLGRVRQWTPAHGAESPPNR
jgi:hypothetical protein